MMLKQLFCFWHTTCDITNLVRPQRFLRPAFQSADSLLDSLKPSFDKLLFLQNHNGFDLGFLEAPPVFPSIWNKSKNDPNWGCFEDSLINDQIDIINGHLRQLNSQLNFVSPKFVCDSMKFRKRGNNRSSFLSSDLFLDGIHPVDCASEKWLYQVIKSVSRGLVW
jgi:hypothetical protein